MKDLNCYSMLIALFLLLCTSCIDEDKTETDIGNSNKSVSLTVNTRTTDDPLAYNFESQIRSIRLYVFDDNAFDKMYYFPKESLVDNNTTPDFLVKVGNNKSVYVIVNEPLDAQGNTYPVFSKVTNIDDLNNFDFDLSTMGLEGNILSMDTANVYLPMSGEIHDVTITDNQTTRNLEMTATRSIARIDLFLRNDENNSVQLNGLGYSNSAEKAYIYPFELSYPDAGYLNNSTSANTAEIDKNDYELYYSFYVPERIYKTNDANPLQINYKLKYLDEMAGVEDHGTINIGNDNNNSDNAPLSKIERNHVYQIKASLLDRSFSTSLTVCPWVELPVQENEIASRDEVKMINCYMAIPGDVVKIPIRNLFYIYPLYEELGKTKIPEGTMTAELYWQTLPTWDNNHASPYEYSVVANNSDVTLEGGETDRLNAVISVKTTNVGSAMIVLKINGDIYWSWHIWCTEYNLKSANSTFTFNGYEYMDRNLGALINVPDGDNKYGTCTAKGLVYQWGRKDPFTQNYPNSDTGITSCMLFSQEYPYVNYLQTRQMVDTIADTNPETIIYSIRRPTNYLIRSKDNYPSETGWCPQVPRRNELWESDKKTIFDPCPVGWRVPPFRNNIIPFDGFSNMTFDETYPKDLGYYYQDSYFPCTNYRKATSWAFVDKKIVSYWSAESASDGSGAYGAQINSDPLERSDWSVYDSGSARAVRCVKDK